MERSAPTLKTIRLHGDVGKKYGKEFRLSVNTVREACNALSFMIPGFMPYVVGDRRERRYRVVRGDVKSGMPLDEDTVANFHIGDAVIHIIPVVKGAKDRGWGKILFGALLFGAGALMGFGTGGFTLTGAAATTGVQVARLGVGIALSGVAQLLSPTPGVTSKEPVDRRESFLFSGPVNRSTQGLPVPLCYGKFMVGSVTVSAGIDTEDVVIENE